MLSETLDYFRFHLSFSANWGEITWLHLQAKANQPNSAINVRVVNEQQTWSLMF